MSNLAHQNGGKSSTRWPTPLLGAVIVISGLFALFLVVTHFVKCYSDPTGWISMAENLYLRGWVPRWSVTYAAYLYWPLKLVGPHYVYISNLPWLVIMMLLLAGAAYRCVRKDTSADRLRAQRIFIWVMLVFIWINHDLARELLNPYREAFTFSFLAASLYVLTGKDQRPVFWRMFCAGVLLGFSTAVREPHLLATVSVGLMLFGMICAKGPTPGDWRQFPMLAAGIAIGMTPFFMQNAAYSGYWWIPSYMWAKLGLMIKDISFFHPVFIVQPWYALAGLLAAGGIAVAAQRYGKNRGTGSPESRLRRWKLTALILVLLFAVTLVVLMLMDWVPAMRSERFLKTGRGTYNHLTGKWDVVGQLLLVLGLIDMTLKRERLLALMTVPSAMIFFVFWCFYTYMKDRYVFGVEFFVYPIMALGAHRTACLLSLPFRSPDRREWVQTALVLCVAASLGGWMAYRSWVGDHSMKVWHLAENKQALEPLLRKPYVFDCSRAHYGQALASTMAGTFTQVHQHNRALFFWNVDEVKPGKLDQSYRKLSEKVFAALDHRNIYDYGLERRHLVRFWLDSIPVIKLDQLPHPINVYGRHLDEPLYHLQTWKNVEYQYNLPVRIKEHEPFLLVFDLFRLWDYPERSFCRIANGDRLIEIPANNHLQWLAFPEGVANHELVFESDAGLPSDPFLHAFKLNDEITLSLGLNSAYWYRNYLSSEFLLPRLIHNDAAILLHEGNLQVPSFADSDREVYVRLHYSHYQGEIPVTDDHRLVISSGSETVEAPIPGKNQSVSAVLALGSGAGGLQMKNIHLRKEAPAFDQHKKKKRMNAERIGFVRLHNFKVWTLPRAMPPSLAVTASPEHEPWRKVGFYPTEKGPSGSFCWMKPDAELHLPRAIDAGVMEGRITLLNLRPEANPATPAWRWNGEAVTPSRMEIRDGGKITDYYFEALPMTAGETNTVGITCGEWVPSRDSGIHDTRSLGLCFLGADFAVH